MKIEIYTKSTCPYCYRAKDLLAKKNKINVHKFDSISLAYQEALNKSQVDDNILMFGSFFVNSEVFQ